MKKQDSPRQFSAGFFLVVFVLLATQNVMAASSDIRINEILFNPEDGAYQWVELKNAGSAPINIAGYRITNEAGAWYTIPKSLPAVPSGAFVVVVFDGAGPGGDELDFGDQVATLHTGPALVNILGRTSGQAALFDSTPFKLFLPGVVNNYKGGGLSVLPPLTDFLPPVVLPQETQPGVSPTRAASISKAGLWSQRRLKSPSYALGAEGAPSGPVILSFVAWGGPPGDRAAKASEAGLWSPRWFKSLARGLGVGSPSDPRVCNETLGLIPGSPFTFPDYWTLYPANQATKGSENAFPTISWFYPADGAAIDGTTFSIHWAPLEKATGYEFQLAVNSNFSPPTVNQTLTIATFRPATAVAPGTYYWRVRGTFDGGKSPWSSGVRVTSVAQTTATGSGGPLGDTPRTLGITWQLQHKDTTMLCLDGCDLTGSEAWDRPHTNRGVHGNNYCARATTSMMASYYGGKLSQDRISYELFKSDASSPHFAGQPEGDLGHDLPVSEQQLIDGLSFALGTPIPAQYRKPDFSEIRTWINEGRPINAIIPGHSRVIDGYWEAGTHQKIHLLDPWDREKWVDYAGDNIYLFFVGPAGPQGAPNVRSDEADLARDTDADGINDFDETYRFHTKPAKGDSDNDWVLDKQEIKDYTFDPTSGNLSPKPANIDSPADTLRKELDPDNDGGGMMDGCEDINHTDSFNPADDRIGTVSLVSPTGTVYTSLPTFKWNAICGAQSYWIQVDDTTGQGKVYRGFSAAEAGCPNYTGTCSVTPAVSLAEGNAAWWVAACHWKGCGPWSNAMGFVVSGGPKDPIIGLWDTGEGGQALMGEAVSGSYQFVAKVTKQGTWWTQRGIIVGEEVWMLNKDPDGRYRGQVLVKGNFYWYMPFDVKIEGNQMIDNTGKLIATKVSGN